MKDRNHATVIGRLKLRGWREPEPDPLVVSAGGGLKPLRGKGSGVKVKPLPQEPRGNSGPTLISEGSERFDLNLNIFGAPSEASTLDRNTTRASSVLACKFTEPKSVAVQRGPKWAWPPRPPTAHTRRQRPHPAHTAHTAPTPTPGAHAAPGSPPAPPPSPIGPLWPWPGGARDTFRFSEFAS